MPAFIYVSTYIVTGRDRIDSPHPACFLRVGERQLSRFHYYWDRGPLLYHSPRSYQDR